MRFSSWLFGLVLTLSISAIAQPTSLSDAIQLKVEKYELANGLTVLLHVDHSVPMVCTQQWFRVGSKDEEVGRTGLAHFFEHMMFKGTKTFSKDTFGQVLASRGVEFNAFTNNDYTGYWLAGPRDNLNFFLNLESDRMRNLTLDPNDVKSEREVVKEERRMRYDNQPEGVVRETLEEMMFKNLPYRWPVIGSMEDLNKQGIGDMRAFYSRFYSPNNAILVVAGDFDPAAAKTQIEKFYGKIPREEIVRPKIEPEWDQPKNAEQTITRNVQSPVIGVAYIAPPATSNEIFALDLISVILGQGESSRLNRRLVYRDQTATNVAAGCQDQVLASRCYVFAYAKPNANPRALVKTITEEVKKLADHPVSAKELEKAKNNYMMDLVNELRKLTSRAQAIAYNETLFGDYRRLYTDIPNMQAVTAQNIQEAARKYLKPQHQNVVVLMPEKSTGKKEK